MGDPGDSFKHILERARDAGESVLLAAVLGVLAQALTTLAAANQVLVPLAAESGAVFRCGCRRGHRGQRAGVDRA